MGEWSNIREKFSGGEFHMGGGVNLGGEFWEKNESLQNGVAK